MTMCFGEVEPQIKVVWGLVWLACVVQVLFSMNYDAVIAKLAEQGEDFVAELLVGKPGKFADDSFLVTVNKKRTYVFWADGHVRAWTVQDLRKFNEAKRAKRSWCPDRAIC
jgi:prepilin-type processing-associated H-X9-DG protein